MKTFKKGSDLLSKRILATSSLIAALASTGLSPLLIVTVSIALLYILRK